MYYDASVLVGNDSSFLILGIKTLFLMIRRWNTQVSLAYIIVLLSFLILTCSHFYLLSTSHRRIGWSFEMFVVSLFVNMDFRFNQMATECSIWLFVLIILKSYRLGSQAIIWNNRTIWDGSVLKALHFQFCGIIGYFIQIAHLSLTLDAIGNMHAVRI